MDSKSEILSPQKLRQDEPDVKTSDYSVVMETKVTFCHLLD